MLVVIMGISSQASNVVAIATRVDEGSETRGRVKTVMPPRVPCFLSKEGDIVRYSSESQRDSLNSYHNICEEYNQIQSYGQNPDAGYISEGDLPTEDDSQYERKFSLVKYLGTTRQLSAACFA